jgi:hypothetical protein
MAGGSFSLHLLLANGDDLAKDERITLGADCSD